MALSSAGELLKPGMESVICDLCHSDQSEVVTRQRDLLLEVTNDEFTIVRCHQCGLIYLNPRPSKDLLGSYYPTVYYPPVQAKVRPQLQQRAKKVSAQIKQALVVPGSGLVKRQAEAEGLDRVFMDAGFEWREPGCSMCLAMNADRLEPGERCASTSNRNFEGRQGYGGRTHLVSPAVAAAAAIAGHFVDMRDW